MTSLPRGGGERGLEVLSKIKGATDAFHASLDHVSLITLPELDRTLGRLPTLTDSLQRVVDRVDRSAAQVEETTLPRLHATLKSVTLASQVLTVFLAMATMWVALRLWKEFKASFPTPPAGV